MGGKLSVEELAQRHVVIIGGGYAGMELGTILLKWEVPFTIIDPKEYFHHVVGGLRAVVDRGNNKQLLTEVITSCCFVGRGVVVKNHLLLCTHYYPPLFQLSI